MVDGENLEVQKMVRYIKDVIKKLEEVEIHQQDPKKERYIVVPKELVKQGKTNDKNVITYWIQNKKHDIKLSILDEYDEAHFSTLNELQENNIDKKIIAKYHEILKDNRLVD